MARHRGHDPAGVLAHLTEARRATWDWLRRSVSGREFIYSVSDGTPDRLHSWRFVVQVPGGRSTPVIVRPRDVPPRRAWAGIDRKSIAFINATRHPYRGRLYCKVSLADPTGKHTRLVVAGRERGALPRWIAESGFMLRRKAAVTTTRGTDEKHLVIVVKPDDHQQMIRVFFATKVWVLQEKFLLA